MGSDREIEFGELKTDHLDSRIMCTGFDGHTFTAAQYNTRSGLFNFYRSEPETSREQLHVKLRKYKNYGGKKLFSIANKTFTAVPEGVFSRENADDYLSLLFTDNKLKAKNKTDYCSIKSIRAGCVYAFEQKLQEDAAAEGFQLHHAAEGNLSLMDRHKFITGGHYGVIFIYSRFFYLFLYHNGLVFANAFPVKNEADLAYYTLFSMEQRGFEGKETHIYFARQNNDNEKAVDILNDYVKKTAPVNGSLAGKDFDVENTGIGMNLYSQILCV